MAKQQYEIPVQVNDTLELCVETLASGGNGIARHEGYTLFVPSGLPGDRARCRVTKVTPRFGVTRVLELLEPSADRVPPPCPVFPKCGGCRLQNWSYGKQLAFKVQTVRDALRHIGGLDANAPIESFPADPIYHYRNKGNFAVQKTGGNIRIGFFETGSHRVVDSAACDTLLEPVNAIKEWIRPLLETPGVSIYDERRHRGLLRGVVVRHSESTGESLLGLVTTAGEFSQNFLKEITSPQSLERFRIQGVVQNINPDRTNIILGKENRTLWGRDHLIEELGGLQYHLSLGSFFQVNPFQAVRLYDQVRRWVLETPGPVVDAYCGNGGITLWLAKEGVEVLGIDEFAPAIEDARQSAELNGLETCRFQAGAVEALLDSPAQLGRPRILIVDPPRKGLSRKVVDAIPRLGPERLIYISCNPATLARDLALLTDYAIKKIVVIDMFPQTPHVETAVLLQSKSGLTG